MDETLDGHGKVYDGEELKLQAEYYLCAQHEQADQESLRVITGNLKTAHGQPALAALVGQSLVLHLEDGRRLDFFFKDDDGNIAARSDLYTPGDSG